MKIIQTLYNHNNQSPILNSMGFLSPEFNWMSWALSCLQLNELYGNVELYTNTAGKEVLIDILNLPYKKVHLDLNDFDIPPNMWVLPKICTYSLQNSPFIHIDGDVFIWEKFDDSFLKSPIIAQNLELSHDLYAEIHKKLSAENFWMPELIKKQLASSDPLAVFNAGVLGGSDIDFFKYFTEQSFQIINKNREKIPKVDAGEFNLIYEQHLFYALIQDKRKVVNTLFSEPIEHLDYDSFGDFLNVPNTTKFIHMLGNFKRWEPACLMLARRLRQNYPDYYYRIIDKCKSANVNLYMAYYNLSTAKTSNALNNGHNWTEIYNFEKDQDIKFEFTFSNLTNLNNSKFCVNPLSWAACTTESSNSNLIYYIPNGTMKRYDEHFCDNVDSTLINLLKEPKNVDSLITEINKFIEQESDKSRLFDYVTNRIKIACKNHLFIIVS